MQQFLETRKTSELICAPLETEDFCIQAMEDVSPLKWHMAHTTWFFDEFILKEFEPNYQCYHKQYNYLFNSYYKSKGEHWTRAQRGLLARPTVKEVYAYRNGINERVAGLIEKNKSDSRFMKMIEIGIHHEQQHQELMLMDLKYNNSINPLDLNYRDFSQDSYQLGPQSWLKVNEGLYEIGRELNTESFAFDNESPEHKFHLRDFEISDRTVTNGEYLEFLNDGAYERADLWHSDAWDLIQQGKLDHPLYWQKRDNEWWCYTLNGWNKVEKDAPVCHLSFYEAHAYASWTGYRLPTEQEWEIAAKTLPLEKSEGYFLEDIWGAPQIQNKAGLFLGNVWEWTSSPYTSYPGYRAPKGALGEYNGKFMMNQMVLRGGSAATPKGHIRETYRNFFYPEKQWAFSGLRLARDINEEI